MLCLRVDIWVRMAIASSCGVTMGLCDLTVIELRDEGLEIGLPSGVGELRYGEDIVLQA